MSEHSVGELACFIPFVFYLKLSVHFRIHVRSLAASRRFSLLSFLAASYFCHRSDLSPSEAPVVKLEGWHRIYVIERDSFSIGATFKNILSKWFMERF